MADEKMVEKELLADGWKNPEDGKDYVRGDVITLSEEHAKVLEFHGSVGDKGTIEKREKEAADEREREARRQRYLTGLQDPDDDNAERASTRSGAPETASSGDPGPSPRATGTSGGEAVKSGDEVRVVKRQGGK